MLETMLGVAPINRRPLIDVIDDKMIRRSLEKPISHKFKIMGKKFSTAQKRVKKTLGCSSSSSSSGSMQSPDFAKSKGKENINIESYKKRLVFGENNSKSPCHAGNRKPKARCARKNPQMVTAGSRKRKSYIVYDESSDEDIQPTSKKVTALRRGLKISSAAKKKFERELPWQLKVPLTDSTAFSKSNRKPFEDEKAAAVNENGKNKAMKEIKRHLKVHDQKFDEIKEMLEHIVARNLVRERVHGKMHHFRPAPKPSSDCQIISQGEPVPRPSDCQIIAQSVWVPPGQHRTPPTSKNPRKTPGSSGKKVAAARPVDPHQLVDAADFMNCRRTAAASEIPISLRLPSEVVLTGNYDWFTELYDDEITLRDEHMDVLINWLVVKFEKERGASARDFSILEMWAWGGLTQNSFNRCDDDVMPYVRGSYPLNRGRGWDTVEKVYGFGHVNEDHWVGFEINLREQCITVLDSLFRGSPCIGGYFAHMSRNLPRLCEKFGLWEKKGIAEPLHTPWEVVYAADCPRQEDETSCGIFVMKALEVMARGDSFKSIRPDHVPVYRLQFCVDLHAHSKLISESK